MRIIPLEARDKDVGFILKTLVHELKEGEYSKTASFRYGYFIEDVAEDGSSVTISEEKSAGPVAKNGNVWGSLNNPFVKMRGDWGIIRYFLYKVKDAAEKGYIGPKNCVEKTLLALNISEKTAWRRFRDEQNRIQMERATSRSTSRPLELPSDTTNEVHFAADMFKHTLKHIANKTGQSMRDIVKEAVSHLTA